MILSREIIKTLKFSKKPWIIIFSSFVHGSGKSTLSKMLEKDLRRNGIRVYRIYIGKIFRHIAVSRKQSIEELIKNLENNLYLDLEVDKKTLHILKNLLRKNYYQCIIVDSSIAPYYLAGDRIIKIYIYSNINSAAQRLLKSKRIGDSEFSNEREIINKLLERSIEDYKRYKNLSKNISEPFWKNVYKNYGKFVFDIKHDNSLSLKTSFRKLIRELNYVIKTKSHRGK